MLRDKQTRELQLIFENMNDPPQHDDMIAADDNKYALRQKRADDARLGRARDVEIQRKGEDRVNKVDFSGKKAELEAMLSKKDIAINTLKKLLDSSTDPMERADYEEDIELVQSQKARLTSELQATSSSIGDQGSIRSVDEGFDREQEAIPQRMSRPDRNWVTQKDRKEMVKQGLNLDGSPMPSSKSSGFESLMKQKDLISGELKTAQQRIEDILDHPHPGEDSSEFDAIQQEIQALQKELMDIQKRLA